MEKAKTDDVSTICAMLNNQNKKYVLAVANALKFTQENDSNNKKQQNKKAG